MPVNPGLQHPFEVDLDAIYALPEVEQSEWLARYQQFQSALKANPMWAFLPHLGEHGFKTELGLPLTGTESRGQVEFLEAVQRHVFLIAIVASNRFGKTEINILEAALQTLPWDFIPPWLAPYKILDPAKRDVRMRFVGPDKDHWRDQVCQPKMRKLLPPSALRGGSFDKAWSDRSGKLTFADGSYWDFLTHDMELDAFAGTEMDAVRFDEEPSGEQGERKYDESVRGLVDRGGYCVFTLTPVEGIGWLHDELADENDDPRKDDEAWCVTGAIDHNPHLSEEGKRRAKARWVKKPSEYQARAEGLWTHREGPIFPEFKRFPEGAPGADVNGHLRAPRPLRVKGAPSPIDADTGLWRVPVFEAIDPGINVDHPFAFTVAFLNTGMTDVFGMTDVLEVFFAYKEPDLDTTMQAAIVHETRARFGYEPAFTVIDPAAKNRNPDNGRRLVDAWHAEEIFPVFGQNDRALTYDAWRTRLNTHRWVMWSSLNPLLGDEVSKYRWKKPTLRVEGAPRPEPVKKNDDLVDTQRYMLARLMHYTGQAAIDRAEDELLPEALHPQRDLLRRHMVEVRKQLRRGGRKGRVGGVAP